MISKELLSKVFNIEGVGSEINVNNSDVHYHHYIEKEKNVHYRYKEETINIHELAHKCKEWASNNFGYIMQSWTLGKEGKCKLSNITNGIPIVVELCLINADTEQEAIFKTCEWILEQKNEAM